MKGTPLLAFALSLALSFGLVAHAQTVSGVVFEDANANGQQDAGEEALDGVSVRLYGQLDAGGTFDQTDTTDPSGLFSFSTGNGCYLLDVADPPGWRRTFARFDEFPQSTPGYSQPIGVRRFGGSSQLLENVIVGDVLYSSLGDSIAWNWNSCFDTSSFFYSQQVRDRLRCVSPSGIVNLDEAAVKGEHTDDLLVDETNDLNNVFRIIERQAQLVTISMVGNDLLGEEPEGNDPAQPEINRFVAEMIDSRQNLQEVLSSLTSEIPGATVELNTLYDNLADDCDSSTPHNEWLPLLAQMLRDLAWGQVRRATNAEVYAEFANEDLLGACTGFEGEICQFLDGIHPTGDGYEIIREKVWESINGVNLGPRDAAGAASVTDLHQGYLRRVARLAPAEWEVLGGANVDDAEAAFDDDDAGAAAAITLGIGAEEVRFRGFPDWLDELVPVRVIAGVRYRTSGDVTDDFYRIEASRNGVFRPAPGHAYTPTDWDFFTPIVGGGGPNKPDEAPDYPNAKLLVVPDVASFREASATLTTNPVVSADGRGYEWPALTREELGDAEIRVAAAPVAGTPGDAYQVLVDAVWLDVYGIEKERPGEVGGLLVDKAGAGALELSFDELAGSELYNVYFGDLPTLREGSFSHGSETEGAQLCDEPTGLAGPGRLSANVGSSEQPSGSTYILVTGRVDGVESPAGSESAGEERDRSQNTCP